MQIPTLRQYITINSGSLHVRSCVRQPDDARKFKELEELNDRLLIEPVGFELTLQDIYADIILPPVPKAPY